MTAPDNPVARLLCSGNGDGEFSRSIARPNDPQDYVGLTYGLDGVCHQMANRLLYFAHDQDGKQLTANGAKAYNLSVRYFGPYGGGWGAFGEPVRREWQHAIDAFKEDLATLIDFLVARAQVREHVSAHITLLMVCWQAAVLACFLSSRLSGPGVANVIWRISETLLVSGGLRMRLTPDTIHDFFILLPQDIETANLRIDELKSCADDEDQLSKDTQVEWLLKNSRSIGEASPV